MLWALPTGLYLVGSRAGDEVNLMTANLVVQVCIDPKLVAGRARARLDHDPAGTAGGSFSDLAARAESDRDVVRRFVKPVTEVERDPDGAVLAMSGRPVTEVGPDRLPVLAAAVGHLTCTVTAAEELGSHLLCIGEVTEVWGEPSEVLRMEDTRMHYGG